LILSLLFVGSSEQPLKLLIAHSNLIHFLRLILTSKKVRPDQSAGSDKRICGSKWHLLAQDETVGWKDKKSKRPEILW
jgi:hypothetical protein